MSKLDALFQTKEFISVKVHLSKVREREKMNGQYLLSNGKKVEGVSYNNNDLSGTLEFFNNDDEPSSEEFIRAFNENNWAIFVEESIDKFEGPGRSIDYELDDFEEFIDGNSEGCDYEANIEPDYLIFNFEGKQEKFVFDGRGNYKYDGEVITKSDLLKILSNYIASESPEASNTTSDNLVPIDIDILFTVEQIRRLKTIFEKMLIDEDAEVTEFESAIVSNKSAVIFSQEDPQALDDAEKFIIRVEERTYKKTEIKSSSTISKFSILFGNKNEDLTEFKKAISTYFQSGGSPSDFKV
jgi:hypothetical protein